jgi:hypothetical protein
MQNFCTGKKSVSPDAATLYFNSIPGIPHILSPRGCVPPGYHTLTCTGPCYIMIGYSFFPGFSSFFYVTTFKVVILLLGYNTVTEGLLCSVCKKTHGY